MPPTYAERLQVSGCVDVFRESSAYKMNIWFLTEPEVIVEGCKETFYHIEDAGTRRVKSVYVKTEDVKEEFTDEDDIKEECGVKEECVKEEGVKEKGVKEEMTQPVKEAAPKVVELFVKPEPINPQAEEITVTRPYVRIPIEEILKTPSKKATASKNVDEKRKEMTQLFKRLGITANFNRFIKHVVTSGIVENYRDNKNIKWGVLLGENQALLAEFGIPRDVASIEHLYVHASSRARALATKKRSNAKYADKVVAQMMSGLGSRRVRFQPRTKGSIRAAQLRESESESDSSDMSA